MDNNNPVNQTPTAPAQNPVQTAPPSTPPPAGDTGSKNIMIWVIVGLVILILAVGGGYLYMSRPTGTKLQTTPPSTTKAAGSLEDELNALDVESEGNDFSQVDRDLQSL